MCMKKVKTTIICCRYPSSAPSGETVVLVSNYTQAFKLMRTLLQHGIITDSSDFAFRPVEVGSDD